MAFKFQSPVKLPRWTTEEFQKMKLDYQAKYGSTVYIPGYQDIIKWDTTPEPTEFELRRYKLKDTATLGEARYLAIQRLMAKKKENFLRMLSSPSPNIVHNIASIMTTLDDINDALGTFAMVARIVARRLPASVAKFFTGPAGWALIGADLANVAMDLSRLPFKARRIQHILNDTVKGNPLSKKAKLCRLNKLKRLRLSKGEIIEALQTTENMFGIGLSLGPIVGLLTDIPAGLVKHIQGKKVEFKGLPAPLLWFDRIWSNLIKSAATLWTGLPIEMDEELTKSIVAVNMASQVMRTIAVDYGPLDSIFDIPMLTIPARAPEHPSTRDIISDEFGGWEGKTGWLFSNEPEITATHIYNESVFQIMENISAWRERNKHDTTAMVAAQNQVDAGLDILGALFGDDCLQLEYDPHTTTMLKLMNEGYRYPWHVESAQVQCFKKHVEDHMFYYGEIDNRYAYDIAKDLCCFEFVTLTPGGDERPVHLEDYEQLEIRANRKLWLLQLVTEVCRKINMPTTHLTYYAATYNLYRISSILNWFQEHSWAAGHPSGDLCASMEGALVICMDITNIPVTKTRCCRTHYVPLFSPDDYPTLGIPFPELEFYPPSEKHFF